MIKTIKELGYCLQKKINQSNFKNLQYYKLMVGQYVGDDWKKSVVIDPNHYHRQKVFECNEFDMYIITWDKFQKSQIHNHANLGCLNKVLEGCLHEHIYNTNDLNKPLLSRVNEINSVSYIDNSIGYHRIENKNQISVSLHIYSPSRFKTKYF